MSRLRMHDVIRKGCRHAAAEHSDWGVGSPR
eukprot:CAMPEP_0183336432 /NCGR_PEP_ID=MMETSP0164_2-20130417/4409_1 /TAXON_ID=221442 /ORGANISM="Coccolithus pelagicus ssp braarudi, Strain PLY182g" /LENGTH=30 /DNA_ID= /DNA_START= /DNA_END= /DNA_ORIENTATION=